MTIRTSKSFLRLLFKGILLTSVSDVQGLVAKPSNPTHMFADENKVKLDENIADGERPLSLLSVDDAFTEQSPSVFFDEVKTSVRRHWHKLLGGEEDVQECPLVSLNPDAETLALRMKSGPVYADSEAVKAALAESPHHVFISGPAYGGTTAVYNLVGTSPMASNLCAAKTPCCEGSWLLEKRGLIEFDKRYSPDQPHDWNVALKVFNEYWNTSKKVLVEKSPESLSKFTHMYKDLSKTGKRVSFIYVTRSPCYPPEGHIHFPRMHELTQQIDQLKAAGARVLVIRMEDLEHDPYGAAREILEFVPELQSLDPMQNSIDSDEVKIEGGERAVPIAKFAASRDFQYGRRHEKIIHCTAEDRRLMRKLGYPERLVQQSE